MVCDVHLYDNFVILHKPFISKFLFTKINCLKYEKTLYLKFNLEAFMIFLPNIKSAWNTPQFNEIFTQEISEICIADLPLQKALQYGNYVTDENVWYMILSTLEHENHFRLTIGVFFSSVICGCSCADDPTPIDTHSEYCELELLVSKKDGATQVKLLS